MMAKKTKKTQIFIALVGLLILAVGALGACGGKTDENVYVGTVVGKQQERVTYNSETYREKLVTEKYKTTGEGVTIDGVIDESAWLDAYPLEFMMGGIDSRVYTVFGEDGLYLAARTDMKAYYRITRAADSNCGGNFFIAPFDSKNAFDKESIQIVYTARGYVMTSRGDGAGFATWWVDTFVKTHVDGGWTEEGDGSLRDSGGLQSAGDYVSVEAFIPWVELGLTEKPETIKLMSQFNYNDNSTGYRVFAGRPAGAYNNPRDWFVFDKRGYIHNDARLTAENTDVTVPVGHSSGNMSKTGAWDFDKVSEGIIRSGDMAQSQFLYFKDIYAENWMIEANVKWDSNVSGSVHSVGLCAEPQTSVSGTTRTPVSFNLPCAKEAAGKARWTIYSNTAQSNVNIARSDSFNVMTEFVNLKLIKTGSVFSAFVNDTLFSTQQFDSLAGKAAPAIVAAGVVAQFKDLQATTDYGKISEYLAARNLITVSLQSNEGGALSLTVGDVIYDSNIALVPKGSEATLQVKPTVLANVVYGVESVKIDGVEKISALTDGTITFTVISDMQVSVVYVRIAKPAILQGSITSSAVDAQKAVVKFTDVAKPSDASGRVVYAFTNVRQISENEAAYAFRIADGMYRLWLEYKESIAGAYLISVSDGKIDRLDESGNVVQKDVQKLDFAWSRPQSLVRNVTVWMDYPASPLPDSCFEPEETVSWSGEESTIAVFDRDKRTLTAVREGTFTLTAQTEGYSEVYVVTVKSVNKTGSQWTVKDTDKTYVNTLKEKWTKDGKDVKTTLFIGDSFFDTRNFWTNFYDTYNGVDAICAGIGGTTTYDWEQFAETFLKFTKPKNIVVHLGTNNIYSDKDSTETIIGNLQRLFVIIHDILPDTNIYYFAITQRSDTTYKESVSATNDAMQAWCEGYRWIHFLDTEDQLTSDMLKDGIHPQLVYYSVFKDALKNSNIVMEQKINEGV